MNYKQETFVFHENFSFQLFQTSKKQEQLHCHDCMELNLVEKGRGKYIIGGKLYAIEPGDIFVINNSERHLALHQEEELTLTVLVIDSDSIWKNQYGKEYLKPFLQRGENFSNRITVLEEGYEGMLQAFIRIKEEASEKKAGWQMVTEAAAHLLLSLLYRYYHERQEIAANAGTQNLFGRISKVFSYIDEHFAEEITLEQLAQESALSRTYLCKCFKELTGQTVFAYIEQTRIQHACYLLQTTEEPIAQIAMEAGFGSVSYFNRMFKRYRKMTPGQFRRGMEGQPDA